MAKRPTDPVISSPPATEWLSAGELWECPRCGKQYPRRGQGHSCRVFTLEHHFAARPQAGALYTALIAALEGQAGPLRQMIAQTRIGLMNHAAADLKASLTFAAVMPRKDYLRAHFLLRRQVDVPTLVRVDEMAGYYVHIFEVRRLEDISPELLQCLAESYGLALQKS